MPWINEDNYPKNKAYSASSTKPDDIAKDISTVIERSIKMKSADNADGASAIMIFANATNGYIGIYLYDMDEMMEVGDSSYLLELHKLWDMAEDHEDGSIFFDQTTEKAAKVFANSDTGMEVKKTFELYFMDQLEDEEEL